MKALHHLLRYLKSAPGQRLFFPTSSSTQLRAFSDTNWAACTNTRKFVMGFCVFLGNALILWKAKKQAIISHSSTKAEYRAFASTTSEVLWFSEVLRDFQSLASAPATIFCDNQSTIHIATTSFSMNGLNTLRSLSL